MARFQTAFGALVLMQAAHSLEEYAGHLWESFPPTRFVSGLISADLERGFIIANVVLVSFGLWCWWWPVRRAWQSAVPITWAWVAIEFVNGVGHPLWTLRHARYTPGVATAPALLLLALYVASQLLRRDHVMAPRGSRRTAL